MATKSNFKRAMPQGQSSVVSALRTTEMLAESKAILPAGKFGCHNAVKLV